MPWKQRRCALMCDGREARAEFRWRRDVQDPAAQSGANSGHDDGVEPEPVCFLLAIDGLEESGQHRRWAELLGELGAPRAPPPRAGRGDPANGQPRNDPGSCTRRPLRRRSRSPRAARSTRCCEPPVERCTLSSRTARPLGDPRAPECAALLRAPPPDASAPSRLGLSAPGRVPHGAARREAPAHRRRAQGEASSAAGEARVEPARPPSRGAHGARRAPAWGAVP